ncbi:hypothetical protein Dret_0063 [Desulfohalobium retbaense DSM 5692]|uniref:Uncharacterized protein n=1 Tax=Desulfohalobium retbaense (strain ATCC 49708 / DSM 5692 / JCM 16813 / HR100) TaxID=485915 RepID=C8WZ90_DESRD|nr:hypothetical protein Dret_0063 [Desulfohalobium retbaense DSM 5692]
MTVDGGQSGGDYGSHGMKSQAGVWRSEEQEMPHARAGTPSSRKGAKG